MLTLQVQKCVLKFKVKKKWRRPVSFSDYWYFASSWWKLVKNSEKEKTAIELFLLVRLKLQWPEAKVDFGYFLLQGIAIAGVIRVWPQIPDHLPKANLSLTKQTW